MSKKNIKLAILIFLVLLAGGFIFRDRALSLYPAVFPGLKKIQQSSLDKIKELEKKIFAPPPLVKKGGAADAWLNPDGILLATNGQRLKRGAGPLAASDKLGQAARQKLDEMFDKQYFEHISPDGAGISDLAEAAGYEYIVLGENLAMGRFENDEDLVGAWMQSPGHRENILNGRFAEIGIAAKKGLYDGEEVWIAVQEFGAPLSLCPKPEDAQRERIFTLKNEVAKKQKMLDSKKSGISPGLFDSRGKYKKAVNDYNELVADYNNSVNELRTVTESYNRAAEEFNRCIDIE